MTRGPSKTVEERFWSKVDIRGEDECWPWTAASTKGGGGRFAISRGQLRCAHRVAYELFYRCCVLPWPAAVVRQTCQNHLCCNPHHLEVTAEAQRFRPLSERLWERVAVGGPDDCWEWRGTACGPPNREGKRYGKLGSGGRGNSVRAHVAAYVVTYGQVPQDLHVLHHCDNPPCCNPAHLYVGTRVENMRDALQRGRFAQGDSHPARLRPEIIRRGEDNPGAKLTREQVNEIRLRYANGESQRKLAPVFSVAQSTISDVVLYRHYR